jgi:hypothetical protein
MHSLLDPKLNGIDLAANVGCNIPVLEDPYAPKSTGVAHFPNFLLMIWITGITIIIQYDMMKRI